MARESPPLPPPPPPSSFPVPFAKQRSTDHTQYVAGTSAYLQAGPPPGNNHPTPMPSPSRHTSQLYTSPQHTSPQPPQPPPVRKSTRPQSNVTAPAPPATPAFTTRPPPYEYAPPPSPLAPQMSGSISHRSSNSDSGQSIPARPPFIGNGTNASGPRSPQRLMTMPVPVLPNTAASLPYHSGSSPPNIVYPPPQSEMSGGPPRNTQGPPRNTQGPPRNTQGPPRNTQGPPRNTQGPPPSTQGPPPNTQGWSYLDLHERDDVSSDSGDEDFVQSPDSMSNSSGHMGQKGPPNPPYAGRRRRPKRRETVPASSSQPQATQELEKCRLCPRLGPRHEWAHLGHGGFCSERHKWQWEETYIRK